LATSTSRRTFLKRLFAAGVVLGGFSYWEAHHPEIERVDVRLRRLPAEFDGFTIAQLTDIHFNDFLHESYFQDIVTRVNQLKPDLIALTGDFLTTPFGTRHRTEFAHANAPPCARVMAGLKAPSGVYAVLGNHDHHCSPKVIADSLRAQNIPVLINETQPVTRGSARIWLTGVDSWFGAAYRPSIAMSKVPGGECSIVMLHEPDCADDIAKLGADFMMAGHSHGGQVRIPLIGAVVLPPKSRKYPIGLRTIGDLQLYTIRGIGVIHLPVRFACPPEISLFTLRRG